MPEPDLLAPRAGSRESMLAAVLEAREHYNVPRWGVWIGHPTDPDGGKVQVASMAIDTDACISVSPGESDTEAGVNLLAVLEEAAALTPGGDPLGPTNFATVALPPGIYDCVSARVDWPPFVRAVALCGPGTAVIKTSHEDGVRLTFPQYPDEVTSADLVHAWIDVMVDGHLLFQFDSIGRTEMRGVHVTGDVRVDGSSRIYGSFEDMVVGGWLFYGDCSEFEVVVERCRAGGAFYLPNIALSGNGIAIVNGLELTDVDFAARSLADLGSTSVIRGLACHVAMIYPIANEGYDDPGFRGTLIDAALTGPDATIYLRAGKCFRSYLNAAPQGTGTCAIAHCTINASSMSVTNSVTTPNNVFLTA